MPRDKIAPGRRKTVQLMIRVTPATAAAIARAAERAGNNYASEWIRSLIDKELEGKS